MSARTNHVAGAVDGELGAAVFGYWRAYFHEALGLLF
jgi:hypothetical protein